MGALRIDGTWRTTAGVEAVWAVLIDLPSWPAWWPAIREVELVAGTPDAPEAARMTFDTPSPLRPLSVRTTITDLAAPTRLVAASHDGPIGGDARFELIETDEATAVHFDLHLQVRSRLLRPIEHILARASSGAGKQRLGRAGDDLAALAGGEPLEHDL